MADGFIGDVIKNNMDGTWDVNPRIIEYDGTDMVTVKCNAVSGIYPQVGDVVMVSLAINNLDDKPVNRFYEASQTNGRIVGVATPITVYQFKGDYKFEGDVEVDGNLEVTGDLNVGQDLIVDGSVEIAEDLVVDGNAEVGGDLDVDGEVTAADAVINNIRFTTHTHPNNAPAPGPTGPPSGTP